MQDKNWQDDLQLRERRKKTACQILGVLESDSIEEIKRAWRNLSLKHHPDRNDAKGESHQKFILINSAYKCLTQRKNCEQLDSIEPQCEQLTHGNYRLDNSWGYFAWWREMYFDDEKGD